MAAEKSARVESDWRSETKIATSSTPGLSKPMWYDYPTKVRASLGVGLVAQVKQVLLLRLALSEILPRGQAQGFECWTSRLT